MWLWKKIIKPQDVKRGESSQVSNKATFNVTQVWCYRTRCVYASKKRGKPWTFNGKIQGWQLSMAYLDTSWFLNGREQAMKAIPAGFQSAHLRTRLVKYRIWPVDHLPKCPKRHHWVYLGEKIRMIYQHQHTWRQYPVMFRGRIAPDWWSCINVGDTILSGDFGCAIHPGRLTWNLQITHLERKITFQTPMIMFHVNLQGCNFRIFNSGDLQDSYFCTVD